MAQGFFAVHGLHGLAALAAQGFFGAQGLAAFMAQGFFAAHGLAAWAIVIAAGLDGPELTSELVQETAEKAIRQTAALQNIADCFLSMTARIVPLLCLHGP
jgi:hypothetical protein